MLKGAFALLLSSLFFLNRSSAQSPANQFAGMLNADTIHKTLNFLASDSLMGRETGRAGQRRAAAYLKSIYEYRGIKTQSQLHSLNIKANGSYRMTVNDENFIYYENYYHLSKQDTVFNLDHVTFAGFGIKDASYNDFSNIDITGKALLVCLSGPKWKDGKVFYHDQRLDEKSILAVIQNVIDSHPAILFLQVDTVYNAIQLLNTNPGLLQQINTLSFPVVFVNDHMAERMLPWEKKSVYHRSLLKAQKKRKSTAKEFETSIYLGMTSANGTLLGTNILAEIPGTDKSEEAIIISAHYDHLGKRDSLIYYGADDNASGTSAVLELARVFKEAANSGYRPKRTLLFLHVSGEEKGLLGSSFYVKHPLWPLNMTVADLNIDMIGRTDEKYDSLKNKNYLYVIGSDKISHALYAAIDSINKANDTLILDYTYDNPEDPNRFYQRSDHYNFAKNHIPIAFFFNGTHEDYHSTTDTPDKIDYDLLRKRAKLIFLTAWNLANRPDRIMPDPGK